MSDRQYNMSVVAVWYQVQYLICDLCIHPSIYYQYFVRVPQSLDRQMPADFEDLFLCWRLQYEINALGYYG